MPKNNKTALGFKIAKLKRNTLFSLFLVVIGFTWFTSKSSLLAKFGGFLVMFSFFVLIFFLSALLYYVSYTPEQYEKVIAKKSGRSLEQDGFGKYTIFFLGLFLGFTLGVFVVEEPSSPVAVNSGLEQSAVQTEKGLIGGTWQGVAPTGGNEYLTFSDTGMLNIVDGTGASMEVTYETVELVEPYQLYVYLQHEGNSERLPLGIYKVEGDKMLFRDVIEIHKAIGLVDVGVSRYEMPKDFSVGGKVYKRVEGL